MEALNFLKRSYCIALFCILFCTFSIQAEVSVTIKVISPGTLYEHIDFTERIEVTDFTVQGNLNSDDIFLIREMFLVGKLSKLDMTEAWLVVGGYSYYKENHVNDNAISNEMFRDCIRLTSILLPTSIRSIENKAFLGCKNLQSIIIPSGVTSIGDSVFTNCSSLKQILVENDNPNYSSQGGMLFDKRVKNLITCPSGKIGECTVPNGVRSIEKSTFQYCKNITSIILPKTTQSIGDYAFLGCTGLTSIFFPDSIQSIGEYALSGCLGLNQILLGSNNTSFCLQDGVLFNKEKTTLIACPALKTGQYTVPSGTQCIRNSAFDHCGGLTSIVLPESLNTIGIYAFYYCTGLTSMVLPDSVKSIGESAFNSCTGLTSINLPKSLLSIDYFTFSGCTGLTGIIIPENIQSIGFNAFHHCSGLKSISIPGSVKTIGAWAFSNCSGLTSVNLSSGVKSIEEQAFVLCSSLTSITIPESVVSIGGGLFSACTTLSQILVNENNRFYCSQNGVLFNRDATTILAYPAARIGPYTIPNGVTSIELRAFDCCSGLSSVTIPCSVSSIGDYAFLCCSGLTQIISERTVPIEILNSVFNAVDKFSCTLYVPAGSLKLYRTALVWNNFTKIEERVFVSQSRINEINPTIVSGKGWINIMGAKVGEIVSIYNCLGKLIQTNKITGQNTRINLSENQIYFINVSNRTFKIVLN